MPATVETSISEQLKALIRLQAVDSKIDQVKKLRGDLPEEIRNSMILTGNDLGMLANVEALPTKEEIDDFIKDVGGRYPQLINASQRSKHKKARDYLSYGNLDSAWKILLS